MKNYKFKLTLFIIIIVATLILFAPQTRAQSADNNPDAIAIRVIPNPNHYSVTRWYQNQGFSGSPQALTVDGYEALRDGRTVYINAANVVGKTIYTNIYLISYNQDYSVKTVDILGQIIANWKFNDNLPAEASTCSISALKCEKDADCASSQSCDLVRGACVLKEVKSCAVDTDCPVNFFCDSIKAKIIRDLKRVGRVEEIREALTRYRNANGRYPLLDAGTYLPGKTTSLWPSWNQVFLPAVGLSQGVLDPVNRFGSCPGYDAKTCWDKDKQEFIGAPAAGDLTISLPADSHALVYTTNQSGSQYNICAVMESREPELGYTLYPNDPIGSSCVTNTGILATGNAFNNLPQITELSLKGIAGREYNGFVKAVDIDNDPLTWSLSGGSWAGWSAMPAIQGTSDPNQKKLFSSRAGSPGIYPVTITVRDTRGGVTSTTTNIEIISSSSFAEVDEYNYRLDPIVPFDYSFYVSGNNAAPTYGLRAISEPDVLRYSNIRINESSDGTNRVKVSFQGIISPTIKFNEDTETVYELTVNSSGATAAVSRFIVRIKIDRPILELNCETQSRHNYDYSCRLGNIKQGNHDIEYNSVLALPAGLSVGEKTSEPGVIYLFGKTTTVHPGQEVRIRAVNEYGTETIRSFILRVNTYCGDGFKQAPNMEGRGGVFNNGYEACDGKADEAVSATDSSKYRQYACNTPTGAVTPYPISGSSYCVFKSPLDGGGYCGDTYCQTRHEDKSTCPFDCDPAFSGSGQNLGGDNPGAISCQLTNYCPDGQTCVNGTCVSQCWDREVVSKVQFSEGDATRPGTYEYRDCNFFGFDCVATFTYTSTKISPSTDGTIKYCFADNYPNTPAYPRGNYCTIVRIDDPFCTNSALCPVGFSDLKQVGLTGTGDTCRDKSDTCPNRWCQRRIYECSKTQTVTYCVGDACSTTGGTVMDGKINSSGQCIGYVVVTPPVIPADSCSSDSECATGQECVGVQGSCVDNNTRAYSANCDQYSFDSTICVANPYYSCDWVPTILGTCVTKQVVVDPTPTPPPTTCTPVCEVGRCGDNQCGGTCPCYSGSACDNATKTCKCLTGCAYTVASSNVNTLYNCSVYNNYCSPGGGYCGDLRCDDRILDDWNGLIAGETFDNCPTDCSAPRCECKAVNPTFQCGRAICPDGKTSYMCGVCEGQPSGGWQSYECINNMCVPKLKETCGNGVIDAFETCDDGANNIAEADIPTREQLTHLYNYSMQKYCTTINCLRMNVYPPKCGDGICDFDILPDKEGCGSITCRDNYGIPQYDCVGSPKCS